MNPFIEEASRQTPDPERSQKGLERLLEIAPDILNQHASQIDIIAGLFSYSQFLTDYSINNPDRLSFALKSIHEPINKLGIINEALRLGFVDYSGPVLGAAGLFEKSVPVTGGPAEKPDFATGGLVLPPAFKQDIIKLLREIKKRFLLSITIRDISGITGLEECMAELSILAEAIIELALYASYALMRERFGDIENNTFSVIALGKLGAGELNYSSDIDIISVYASEEGLSSGVRSTSGVRINKITPHEYFCRLTELLTGLLQAQTENGIAYRVDLRLRPDGRKGELSLSLDSYISYYEAWGKTWERMALIRARPVAGDKVLGGRFIDAIKPFVWKRSTDYYDIEEIRELKRKIDTIFDANDIKRGYGGIREIEFFVQTFQLLYGGERKNLRTGRLSEALDELLREGFLLGEDVKILSDNYTFLRRVEHILQMKDDVQTHTLPAQSHEFDILSRKMRFGGEKEFASELKLRRLKVRDMYNSLLGGPGGGQEAAVFLEEGLTDDEIRDYLSFKGFKNPDLALKNITALNEQINLGKTIRERTLLRKTIPLFLEQVLKTKNKDKVLSMFVTFIEKTGNHESYIDLFSRRPDTIELIISIFSESSYLTRSLLSLDNLESIFEYPDIRMDYDSIRERLLSMLRHSHNPMDSVREFRIIEEMRAGALFIKGFLDIAAFSKKLSMLADTVVRTTLKHLGGNTDFAVIGLGKLGSGEINIGSDLDLIFVSGNESSSRLAEELIRFISEYTAKGFVYEVDMRLRPDGSKGILVNDIDGYRNYYLKSAQPWEIQALLRARPIAGDPSLLKAFHYLKRQAIIERGDEIRGSDVKGMRQRIVNEISKESIGFDIKLGPGGIEEIEFLIQYLQLKNAAKYPGLITHKTLTAAKRLAKHGVIDGKTGESLMGAYKFMKTVDTYLRLNEERVLRVESNFADTIAGPLGFKSRDELIDEVEKTRRSVADMAERYYG